MSEESLGIGGSYILEKNGSRVKVEGTVDRLDAPASGVEAAASVVETASPKDDAQAKEV